MKRVIDQPPYKQAVVDQQGALDPQWFRWGTLQILAALQIAVQTLGTLTRDNIAASLTATTVLTPSFTGVYRIGLYLRVTRAADSSSSVATTLRWTDGGVACSVVLTAAVTGNTTATIATGSAEIQADGGTAITVETTYASVGATSMAHSLRVSAVQID